MRNLLRNSRLLGTSVHIQGGIPIHDFGFSLDLKEIFDVKNVQISGKNFHEIKAILSQFFSLMPLFL